MACSLLSTIWLVVILAETGKPKPLLLLEQARTSIVSGTVEWTVEFAEDGRWGPGNELRFVSRYARNGDMIYEEHGDRDGATVRDANGRVVFHSPQLFMFNYEGFWYRNAASTTARLWSGAKKLPAHQRPGEAKDIRFLGLTPTDASLRYGEGVTRMYMIAPDGMIPSPAIEWNVDERAGLKVVTGLCPQDRSRQVWEIDPARGWNAVRVATLQDKVDTPVNEAVISLRKYGAVWFPEATEFRALGKRRSTIKVRRAVFGHPDDPPKFTANELGVEVGGNVMFDPSTPPKDGNLRPRFWTGESAVTHAEFKKLRREGRITLGPISAALARGEDPDTPFKTPSERVEFLARSRELKYQMWQQSAPSRWSRFVNSVDAAARFDDSQKSSAKSILNDCTRRAREYAECTRTDYVNYVADLAAAKKKNDEKAIERLSQLAAALDSPIHEIETKELVPRIRALLTEEQRPKAAGIEP